MNAVVGKARNVVQNRRVRVVARTTLGLVVVAGVALGVAKGPALVPDAPDAQNTTLAHRTDDVAVQPGDNVLACPGPARLTDTHTGGDAQFAASPTGTSSTLRVAGVVAAASTVTALDGSGDPLAHLAAASEQAPTSASVTGLTGPTTLSSDGGSVVGATMASVTTQGDLRGLAAATCALPATDAWLVGGSTTVGSSTQLVVQNPGRSAATVTVSVYGENGPVPLVDAATLVVPAGKEVVRLVESAAAGQDRVVVRVRSAGAAVAAHLQHTTLDGVVPEGVDLVAPGAAPGRHVAVAGVLSRGEAIDDPRAAQLRLLAPTHAATADLSVWGPSGRVWLHGLESVKLAPGEVVDVPLGGLPAGAYTVVVDATADVVAGALEQRPGVSGDAAPTATTPWDRAWVPSQPWATDEQGKDLKVPVADGSPVAVPAGTDAAVVLSAVPADRSSDAKSGGPAVSADVMVVTSDGKQFSKKVDVAAGSTVVVDPSSMTTGDVAAVAVSAPSTDGPGAVWSVVLAEGAPTAKATGPASGQLFSVVVPVSTGAAATSVTVSQDPGIGLG